VSEHRTSDPTTDQPATPGAPPPAGGPPDRPGEAQGGDAGPEAAGPSLEERLAQAEDRHLRAVADLDNYRKRSSRDVEQRIVGAIESVLTDWLQVVDSIERALASDPSPGPLQEGLSSVLAQIDNVLARQGVVQIGEVGERFDPERHEAIEVRDDNEHPDRTVLAVVRRGYAMGDRLLRPAQVVVSRRRDT
jgi:molecular chaperone GrpE